jgi:hypothetical protein
MITLTSSPVTIQTSEQSMPRVPDWFGEVTVIAHYLRHLGVLADISEHVRFARRRFGHYELIDGCRSCCLAMPSAVNARWRRSTSVCIPLPRLITGALWTRSLARSFDALTLFSRSDSRTSRSATLVVSRRSACTATLQRRAAVRAHGSSREAVEGF